MFQTESLRNIVTTIWRTLYVTSTSSLQNLCRKHLLHQFTTLLTGMQNITNITENFKTLNSMFSHQYCTVGCGSKPHWWLTYLRFFFKYVHTLTWRRNEIKRTSQLKRNNSTPQNTLYHTAIATRKLFVSLAAPTYDRMNLSLYLAQRRKKFCHKKNCRKKNSREELILTAWI